MHAHIPANNLKPGAKYTWWISPEESAVLLKVHEYRKRGCSWYKIVEKIPKLRSPQNASKYYRRHFGKIGKAHFEDINPESVPRIRKPPEQWDVIAHLTWINLQTGLPPVECAKALEMLGWDVSKRARVSFVHRWLVKTAVEAWGLPAKELLERRKPKKRNSYKGSRHLIKNQVDLNLLNKLQKIPFEKRSDSQREYIHWGNTWIIKHDLLREEGL